MKIYFVRLYSFRENEFARFVVQAETAKQAETKATAEALNDGWKVDKVQQISFEHTNIVEV